MITFKIIRSICSALVILLTLSFYLTPVIAADIFLGTHEHGTFSYFTGRLVERVINQKIKGTTCSVYPGPGDIHNLTNLLQGSLDIALIDSKMLHDAVNKTGDFKFLDIKFQNLNIITPLYDVPVTLIVGNNTHIKTLDDLKGKRINIGLPSSFERLFFDKILRAKTWSKNDFSLVAEISASQSQDTMAFCHGDIDAMLHIGVHPDPSLQQLFRLCRAKIIDMNDADIEKLVLQDPAFFKFSIISGTYASQTGDVTTFGTQTLMVASQDIDTETVYAILNAIYTNRGKMSGAHPALALRQPDIKETSIADIKLHAGALKYFSGN